MPPTVTLVIPTISRPTLARTLWSVRLQEWRPGDEILLVGDGAQPQAAALFEQFRLPGRYIEVPGPSRDWGHTPRNLTMSQARGSHLAALDDDDEWTVGALAAIRRALIAAPDRPHLFRMDTPTGTVWELSEIRRGNVGTPMLVTPNDPQRLGRYGPQYGGDHDFISETCAFYPDGPTWHEDVICLVRPRKACTEVEDTVVLSL